MLWWAASSWPLGLVSTCPGHSSRQRGTCDEKLTVHPYNMLVRRPNLHGGFRPAKLPSFSRCSLESLNLNPRPGNITILALPEVDVPLIGCELTKFPNPCTRLAGWCCCPPFPLHPALFFNVYLWASDTFLFLYYILFVLRTSYLYYIHLRCLTSSVFCCQYPFGQNSPLGNLLQ